MEEQKNNQQHPQACNCPWHSGYGHRHFLLRWVLGILILIVVFWLGVKFGEIRGYFGYGYYGYPSHRNMMYPYYGYGQPYPTMMNGQRFATSTPPAVKQ